MSKPEQYIVYQITSQGNQFLTFDLQSRSMWTNKENAYPMEKAVAVLWGKFLNSRYPTSSFSMERVDEQ